MKIRVSDRRREPTSKLTENERLPFDFFEWLKLQSLRQSSFHRKAAPSTPNFDSGKLLQSELYTNSTKAGRGTETERRALRDGVVDGPVVLEPEHFGRDDGRERPVGAVREAHQDRSYVQSEGRCTSGKRSG